MIDSLPADVSEADFQSLVIDYARMRGWLVHHARPALNRSGKWSTPIQGDAGFPDLVLARRGVVLIVELKSAKGRLTKGQDRWLDALPMLNRVCRVEVWRPSDWPEIQGALR